MHIGIDIGGTNIRVASFSDADKAKILRMDRFPVTNQYKLDIRELIAAIKIHQRSQDLHGIGVGIAGILDKEKSYICKAPNLTDWQGKPLKYDLQKEFHCPVALENDAVVAAFGEAHYGLGKNKNFLFIVWGTGIGGAIVKQKNRKVFVYPAEPGHQIIAPDGKQCMCGQRGCLEAYCGGGNIIKQYGKLPDELSNEEITKVFTHFSVGLTNVIAITLTDLIIFSGTVALKQPRRIQLLQKITSEALKISPLPRMLVSKIGDRGALYGAVSLIATR